MKNRYLKISSGLTALYLFGVSLWGFENFISYLAAASLALIVIASLSWKRWFELILPVLLVVGYFGSLATISSLPGKILLGLLVALLFYFYETAPRPELPYFIEEPVTLAAGFLILWLIWAWHFFLAPPWYLPLLLLFGFFSLLYAEIFYKLGKAGAELWLAAQVSSLVMVEVAWAELYWPAHFFTAAVMSFAVFYGIYVLSRDYFSGRLSRKRIYFQAGVILILLAVTLITSPWLPL